MLQLLDGRAKTMAQKEEEVVKEKRLGSKRCNEHKDKDSKRTKRMWALIHILLVRWQSLKMFRLGKVFET